MLGQACSFLLGVRQGYLVPRDFWDSLSQVSQKMSETLSLRLTLSHVCPCFVPKNVGHCNLLNLHDTGVFLGVYYYLFI